jgi:general secretion pathway protein M
MSSLTQWQTAWAQMARRERQGVTLAAVLVALALLWWVALSPALQTLRQAPAQAAQLEIQLQAMQSMASRANALQSAPKSSREERLRSLEDTVRQRLGSSGQLNVQGERVTLTLKGSSGQAVAQWLALARVQARVLPLEAHLQRSASAGAAGTDVTWDGSLVLAVPAR